MFSVLENETQMRNNNNNFGQNKCKLPCNNNNINDDVGKQTGENKLVVLLASYR
jgi:hypothetical protein